MTTDSSNRTTGETLRDSAGQTFNVWQDSLRAMFQTYDAQGRQLGDLGITLLGGFGFFDPDQVRTSLRTIAEGTRELATAQVEVAGEWLRAPLWLTGMASPWDLQQRYARLFEAQRALMGAYIDSSLGWQHRAMAATVQTTERAASALRGTAETQIDSAERMSRNVADAQAASVEATRATAETALTTAKQATDQVGKSISRTVDQVEQERADREAERERAERAAARAERAQEREREEQARARLAARVIKGNINREGEKIYHLPGQANYDQVQAEEIFDTEEQAQAAGYRRSQAAGGGTIKGKVNRDGERIYHLPEQANYDRIEPDQIFETEEQAQANGFRPAQR